MAARRSAKAGADIYDESMPAWQRESIRRSLQSAHARAHARSNRFVTAATQLLQERGNADFTVQEVVDRSRMSIRTFYTYFASKEDLLVAVFETAIAREAVECARRPRSAPPAGRPGASSLARDRRGGFLPTDSGSS